MDAVDWAMVAGSNLSIDSGGKLLMVSNSAVMVKWRNASLGLRGKSTQAMVWPNSWKMLHKIRIKILVVAIFLLTPGANLVVLLMSDDHISSLSRTGKSNDRMDLHTVVIETSKNNDAKQSPSNIGVSLFRGNSPDDFWLRTPHAPACSEPLDETRVSFTLVSQLSYARLRMIGHHCKRWGDHPISIVVITNKKAVDVKAELLSMGCSEEQMTLQTVSKTEYDPDGTQYPVNHMRNLALSAVKTSHIVYADVDFLPSADLYSIISNQTTKERLASDSKLAVVIPAFQMNWLKCQDDEDDKDGDCMRRPRHKEELVALIGTEAVSKFNPFNEGEHGSTMYHEWQNQETGTLIDLPCITSNRYEPYLALRYCSELPPFQEG